MTFFNSVRRRLRRRFDALANRARFERDLRDELRQHLDARTSDLIDAGAEPEEAARQARVEFGAMERYKEECRDERGFAAFRPFHGLTDDVRFAARRLLATPQFVIFAVLSLAVGIGVTTAVYSILYSLSKPIAVAKPERTMVVVYGPSSRTASLTRSDFDELRNAQHAFERLAGSTWFFQPLAEPSRSVFVTGEAVTGDYFATLGLRVDLGRPLQSADEAAGRAVVVLSERLWRTRFDADPSIVGTAVRLGGTPFEVIGVAAAGWNGLSAGSRPTAVWIPMPALSEFHTSRASASGAGAGGQVEVVGLLRTGVTTAAAAAELQVLAARFDGIYPLRAGGKPDPGLARRWSARPINAADASADGWRNTLLIVGMIGLVLVVACLNLSNLMLARGAARQREFAVRRALGAPRWRLVRELCVESAVIAVLGGVVGAVVLRAILRLATIDIPAPFGDITIEPQLDVRSLVVTAGSLLLSLVVFGLEPALQLTRGSVRGDLTGGDAAIGAPQRGRQRGFIRWQVAISATFLLIAAILAKTVVAGLRHDAGVDLDRLGVAVVPLARDWDAARSERALLAAADELRREGTLESVAVSSGVPFGLTATPFAHLTREDVPFTTARPPEFAFFLSSTPQIFRTLGVRIVRGRGLTDRDDAGASPVIVISEKVARDLFGSTDAVGRRLLARDWGHTPDLAFEVIGVSADTDAQSVMSRDVGVVYVPLAQHFEPRVAVILARTAGDPASAARLIQNTLRQIEPDLAVATAGPAPIVLATGRVLARFGALLATTLGLLTLALAMVGLYGVQSHLTAQRTREVGVRMALGAAAREIRLMMLRDGYRPVVEGILLGLVFGALGRTLIRAYISERVTPVDPVAFALVPLPLLLAAFVACYAPARRASRVDPNVALRHL